MKKEKNLQKGITLISLVITVIVLLILAGVAITMAVDADGLFPRAEYAKDQWNNRVTEEETAINNALLILNEIIPQGGTGGGEDGGDDPTLPAGWNKDAVASVVEEGSRKAPIPKGYVASQIPGEDKISDGLVIYEGDDPVTGQKDSAEHKAAMRDRNQYVWIPVDDINKMIMCQTHGASKELDHDTLQCPECGASTKLAGKLYNNGRTFDETTSIQTYTQNSDFREPDTVSADGDNSLELEQLQNAFNEMAKSVAKYKGFYISRYEIQTNAASKQGATVLGAGMGKWYGLYNTIKNSTTPDSTTPQMIWGCQYDQIMLFALEKERKDGTGATFDVKTASDTRKRSSKEVSGNNSADLVCNIYDLENNYGEWTAEAYDAKQRAFRGGNLDGKGSASGRTMQNSTATMAYYSSRSALYVTL